MSNGRTITRAVALLPFACAAQERRPRGSPIVCVIGSAGLDQVRLGPGPLVQAPLKPSHQRARRRRVGACDRGNPVAAVPLIFAAAAAATTEAPLVGLVSNLPFLLGIFCRGSLDLLGFCWPLLGFAGFCCSFTGVLLGFFAGFALQVLLWFCCLFIYLFARSVLLLVVFYSVRRGGSLSKGRT